MDTVFYHQMPAQLRFCDVDQFGHVNNSVYFQLFDMCKTRYFLDVAGQDVFDHLAIVVANINANFLAPIYYPDEIVIESAITHLGNKSFVITQRALNKRTREVKCECMTTMVLFDTHENHSVVIPDDIKEKIYRFEHRQYV